MRNNYDGENVSQYEFIMNKKAYQRIFLFIYEIKYHLFFNLKQKKAPSDVQMGLKTYML
tara:strand:- start:1110 stop:1286 length:177 start_codon:yes stop_codon:yes gene_type:complete